MNNFFKAVGKTITTGLEAVARVSEEMKKQRKEDSEHRIESEMGRSTARAYRQLIDTTDVLITRDKEILVKELAMYLGVNLIKEVTVDDDNNPLVEWTTEEVRAFDEAYNRAKRGSTRDDEMAREIKRIKSYQFSNKNLMDIQQRINQYKRLNI